MTQSPEVPIASELARCFLAAQHPATLSWCGSEQRLELLTSARELDVVPRRPRRPCCGGPALRRHGRREWAGYAGVLTEGETLGLPAYVVEELILTEQFRGRGYGKHPTTLLARALSDDDRTILLGTIHADNGGAVNAALAAGRVDVGGWIQLPADPITTTGAGVLARRCLQ